VHSADGKQLISVAAAAADCKSRGIFAYWELITMQKKPAPASM